MTTRRFATLGAAVLLAAFGPFALNTSGEGGLVKLSAACGQATECTSAINRICSTHHSDYRDYACSKGCGVAPAEEPIGVSTIES